MFYHISLEYNVFVHPKDLGPNVLETVKNKLSSEIVGTCNEKYGFIIIVTTIDSIDNGVIQIGGTINYLVKYKAIVFTIFNGEVLNAVVSQVTKVGIFCEIGMVTCFIPKKYISDSESKIIEKDSEILVKIMGCRVDTNIFCIGSLIESQRDSHFRSDTILKVK
uniref:S1 motif domain-containing protein n=1 Tax=viral metagenome TaxID=1070528 RepID=A0A6C0JUT7_9ZZZZ